MQAGTSGEHDALQLSPDAAVRLDFEFWGVYSASGYPDGYKRAVIRAAYDDFRADFAAACAALTEETEAYLGKKPPRQRLCPCEDCQAERGEVTPLCACAAARARSPGAPARTATPVIPDGTSCGKRGSAS